ncbi:acyl carrier protein [Thermodesulfobacteriota bacterium]
MLYTRDQIRRKVTEVLANKLNIAEDSITLDSSLVDDLGIDSFGAMEMIFDLEETYDIEIQDEEAATFIRVADIVGYMEQKMN